MAPPKVETVKPKKVDGKLITASAEPGTPAWDATTPEMDAATAYEQAHIEQNEKRYALRADGASSESVNKKLGQVKPA